MSIIDLKDKVAIITGASKGIGRAVAAALANENMKLALVSRDKSALERFQNEVGSDAKRILVLPYDLQDMETPKRVIDETINHFNSLDVLINNAGIAQSISFENTTHAEWESHMNLNARAPFFMCQASLPHLRKSDIPTIINMASVVSAKGYANQGAYSASKHALLGFTKVLAKEVCKDNIRVHAISPGGVLTDMVTKVRPDLDTSEMIVPEEIADIILFLLKHRGNAMIDEIKIRRSSKEPWA
jgi:NAD(P)-dependent dehydrogenase (short-subunit alcohol dehydrogenase family)